MISICLRSIRKHSKRYDIEIVVVDNGSKDESLDYFRSLNWIRLIERPEETHTNWPRNVFTAWDRGILEATGEYFITMHSDVFVKRDDWLDPFLTQMAVDDRVAGVGAWKLDLENPLYVFQKRVVGLGVELVKNAVGKKKQISWRSGYYPRDYCAMYRRNVILEQNLTFCPLNDKGGGLSIAKQLWGVGYETRMIPVRELAKSIVHVAHGTAAVVAEKPLHHKRAQTKVEKRVRGLFSQRWVQALQTDSSLDH